MSGITVRHSLTRADAIKLGQEIFTALGKFEDDKTHCVAITAYGTNAPGAFAWKAELQERGGM